MDETKEVRSGEEADAAEIENKPPKTKKKTTKKTAPKKAPETAPETADGQEAEGEKKPKGKTFQENKITDSETARERGHNGGVKSISFLSITDTPGFGQKAAEPAFYEQFAGISATSNFVPGTDFDGISGATITTNGVAKIISEAAKIGVEYLAGL